MQPWLSSKQMDLDAYSAAHRAEWDRLAALARQRSLSGEQADELIDLYQTGATTHPGGSITGAPGRNAAMVLLHDLGHDPAEVLSPG